MALATTTYAGVNRAHLAERDGVRVSERTLRRILGEAGLPPSRVHRPPGQHSRRERMARERMLLGATFREAEDAAGYLLTLTQTAQGYGLPWTANWNAGSSPFAWIKTANEVLAKAVRKRPAISESRLWVQLRRP